jgi:ribokinase
MEDQNSADGRVIVVGSINIDMVMRLPRLPVAGQTVLGGVLALHHGGKGANQAVAASRAGARVHMIGAVGRQDGEQAVAALAADGVETGFVAQVDAPTGHALVLVDDGTGENQIAVAPGANDEVSVDQVDEALTRLELSPADIVLLSFELPDTPLRVAAGIAGWVGARLVVNPAPARPDYDDLLAGAIATPNAGELAALTAAADDARPAGTDLHAAATALTRRTGAPVIVTLGADGALLASGGRSEQFPGYRVDVRDATGAGDTLSGVLAASLAAGHELTVSVRRAVAASALAVTREGARTAMPTAAEIDRLVAG